MKYYNTLSISNDQYYRRPPGFIYQQHQAVFSYHKRKRKSTALLFSLEEYISYEYDRIEEEDAFALSKEFEKEYNKENDEKRKAKLAFDLFLLHFGGRPSKYVTSYDSKKEKEWFLKALNSKSGDAYWLASCLTLSPEKNLAAIFEPMKEAMLSVDLPFTKEASHQYLALAAKYGNADAAWHESLAISKKDNPEFSDKINSLKKFGIEPNIENRLNFVVVAALAKRPDASALLSRLLSKTESKEYPFLVNALVKNGIEVTNDTIYHFQIEAAFSGNPDACFIVSNAILADKKNPSQVGIVKELTQRRINVNGELALRLKVNAAINGHADAAWFLTRVLRDEEHLGHKKHDQHDAARLLLKNYGIKVTKYFQNCLLVNAAFAGQPDACYDLSEKIKNRDQDTLTELEKRRIEPTEKLANQLERNAGLNGHARASSLLATAILDNNQLLYPHLIEAMKDMPVKSTATMGYQIRFISALSGNYSAIRSCVKLMTASKEAQKGQTFSKAISDVGVKDETAMITKIVDQLPEPLKNEVMESFDDNQKTAMEAARKTDKRVLESYRQYVIKNFREHVLLAEELPNERPMVA